MSLGPVEIVCIQFPRTVVQNEMAAALRVLVETQLRALVESQTVRIIDILFIRKDASGDVTITELEQETLDHSILDPLIADISGLISEEDVQIIAESLDETALAMLMLFENTWATAFQNAVLQAGGQLLLSERIPHRVVEEVIAAQAEVTA